MEYIISYKENLESEELKNELWRLLCECDKEFIPNLSSRNSTTDKSLKNKSKEDKPIRYFEELLNQNFVIATDLKGKLIGFMSFIPTYKDNDLLVYLPSNYISTLCIFKKNRGKGIASKLYDYIETSIPKDKRLPYITTRTWHLNTTHLVLLKRRGYKEFNRIINDRGKNIDTVFYEKTLHTTQ